MRINYAIVFVSDMDRSVAFYRDAVGLPLKFASPGWSEFATQGATLALHPSKTPKASMEPPELPPGRCRPGFGVANLDELHARMVENKVRCIQEPKNVFGTRVAEYLDPDGLQFSVGETKQ